MALIWNWTDIAMVPPFWNFTESLPDFDNETLTEMTSDFINATFTTKSTSDFDSSTLPTQIVSGCDNATPSLSSYDSTYPEWTELQQTTSVLPFLHESSNSTIAPDDSMTMPVDPHTCLVLANIHYLVVGVITVFLCVLALADLSMNKTLSGYTTVLLANLFAVDLFAGVLTIFTWLAPCFRWAEKCSLFFGAANIHIMVTCTSIILISISRVLLLLRGTSFKRQATAKRTLAVVLGTWVVYVTVSVLLIVLRPGSSGPGGCLVHLMDNITAHVIIVPLTFGALCPMYTFVIYKVRKHLISVATSPHPAVLNLPPNFVMDKETKVSVTAILVISSFGIFYLPGMFYVIYLYFGGAQPNEIIATITTALTAAHSVSTPLIYGWHIGKKRCCKKILMCASGGGYSTTTPNNPNIRNVA